MGSMIVSLRRRVPKRLRRGALRLLGRRPGEPEHVVDLAIPRGLSESPGATPRTLRIRTPVRTAIVVAFEPTPDLAAQMRAICAENGLDVTVEEVALGAAPGTAEPRPT